MIRDKLGASGRKDHLDLDLPLLDTLLCVPKYTHGARSLEKLVASLKHSNLADPIRRSALPPAAIIAMHVTAEDGSDADFQQLIKQSAHEDFRSPQNIEALAAHIHAEWCGLAHTKQPHLDKDYQELKETEKEDNRAAARRIPDILALIGLTLKLPPKGSAPTPPAHSPGVKEHLEHHLELLAEAEHDGWMDHKFKNGWTQHPIRDDSMKIHNLLIPYRDLPEEEKNKDRYSVRKYPDHLSRAGYCIVVAHE